MFTRELTYKNGELVQRGQRIYMPFEAKEILPASYERFRIEVRSTFVVLDLLLADDVAKYLSVREFKVGSTSHILVGELPGVMLASSHHPRLRFEPDWAPLGGFIDVEVANRSMSTLYDVAPVLYVEAREL